MVLAASDLGSFLECRHKAELDHEVLRGVRRRPAVVRDEVVEILAERGLAFEAAYVAELGGEAVRIEAEGDGAGATVRAMEAGRRVIVQGCWRWGGGMGGRTFCGGWRERVGWGRGTTRWRIRSWRG